MVQKTYILTVGFNISTLHEKGLLVEVPEQEGLRLLKGAGKVTVLGASVVESSKIDPKIIEEFTSHGIRLEADTNLFVTNMPGVNPVFISYGGILISCDKPGSLRFLRFDPKIQKPL